MRYDPAKGNGARRFLIRADASLGIGTGHVVRCATLANELVKAGHEAVFLCEERTGNLIAWLEAQGFPVIRISAADDGTARARDASPCRAALRAVHYDWLVVDHYELDDVWETAMATIADRILAIDDLGRPHACDVLLDQNYSNPLQDLYAKTIGAGCEFLLGPRYALVRPEFAALRSQSLGKPRTELSRLLAFMGGSDPHNETTKALNGIALANMPDLSVDVVIGASNPHRRAVERACERLGGAELHVQTSCMAELMARADCAIGAAGTTTWERCVLGLPALVTIMADNQTQVAERVAAAGGHRLLGWYNDLSAQSYAQALAGLAPGHLRDMSKAAAEICDGRGATRVAARLMIGRDVAHAAESGRHA